MPKLELLTSGPGTGKTTYCIDLFRKEILSSPAGLDSRAYFVLPNREHAGRIQNLVLKKDLPGLFNVHILTMQELSSRLAAGGDLPRPGESMRRSVLRYILEDPSEKWEYFASVKDLPGFYELLSERIQEFRHSLLSADEFERRAKKLSKDAVFAAKAKDLVLLMRRYDEELGKRGFAEEDFSGLEVRTGPGPAPLVILDGFYHFTRAQKTLISALAESGARMVATLTLPEAHTKRTHVFELTQATRDFLEEAGFKTSDAAPKKNRRVSEKALLHLERSLFLPNPGKLVGKQETVRIFAAETLHDEVEAIAREIRRLHRSTDWHFSDMAVILRSVGDHEKTLCAVFGEYEIPVAVHERRKTIESGLGRLTHRLLSLFLSDWRATDLLSLLRSGYLPFKSSAAECAQLEKAAFARNIRSGRDAWLALSKETGASEAVVQLAALENKILSGRSARMFRLSFVSFLRSCLLDPASGDGGTLHALENLLMRAEALYAGKPDQAYSSVRLAEEFQRSVEVGLYSERPSGKNRVQVYDAVMALPKEYRVVFVAGLLDQRFPQAVSEDPFFKDAEREGLNGSKPLLELRASRRSGERYFFYMAVTRARNLLYLSYPRKDRDGRPYLPSIFIEETQRCFTDLAVEEQEPASGPAGWTAQNEAVKASAALLFERPSALPASEKRAVLAFSAKRRKDPRFESILEAGFREDTAKFADPRILESIASEPAVFSPTRLETFVTCAFKYFAGRLLNLRPHLEDRLRAETGTMLHAVLERYYGEKRSKKQIFSDLEKEFEKSPLASEPPFRRAYLLERARRTLNLFLRNESEHDGGFEPAYFELAFGKNRDGSPANLPYLKLGKSGVQIGGFIDRVDVSAGGKSALVIDYKLGGRNLKDKVNKGTEVQLPLYLLAVRQLLGLEPAGAELRFLEKGEKEPLKVPDLTIFLEETEKRIIDAASRIRKGDISIRSKSCEHCDFSTVCRFDKKRLIYAEADRV